MAKIGLAAQLAKQAAQAAREEVAAANGEATSAKPAGKAWTVPRLAPDFALDHAVRKATLQVTGHYRAVLAPQGLRVDLEHGSTGDADGTASKAVAEERHPLPPIRANLREQETGRLVKAYTTPALLTLFATQQQATGVVVDGQV